MSLISLSCFDWISRYFSPEDVPAGAQNSLAASNSPNYSVTEIGLYRPALEKKFCSLESGMSLPPEMNSRDGNTVHRKDSPIQYQREKLGGGHCSVMSVQLNPLYCPQGRVGRGTAVTLQPLPGGAATHQTVVQGDGMLTPSSPRSRGCLDTGGGKKWLFTSYEGTLKGIHLSPAPKLLGQS